MSARQAIIFSFSLLCLGPAVAQAVPQPNGAEFKVSNCESCKKRTPAVAGVSAGATTGSFLIAWESTSPADPLGISARFFTKAGNPRGTDVLVNKEITPEQHDAAVAADPKGNYIVAWAVENGLNVDILAQRYKSTGAANGPAILVSTEVPGAPIPAQDVEPNVAATADGGFVVTWIRSVPPGPSSPASDPAVMVRRYNSAGAPLGPQVKLSTGLVGSQRPDVCIDTAGRAVVAWTSVDEFNPFEPNKKGASVRRVSTTGAAVGATIAVAPPRSEDSDAAVACGAGGTFVVVWSSDQAPAAEGMDILGQRFTTLARRNGQPFRLNSTITGDQTAPAVTSDKAGNFVVVWQSRVIGSPTESIVGRRFLASATADGADFVVHARATQAEERPLTPDVSSLGPVGFVVVWSQGNSGLQGRRFKLTP
jgi:hypothetical protein